VVETLSQNCKGIKDTSITGVLTGMDTTMIIWAQVRLHFIMGKEEGKGVMLSK
jgi:hypothetical protein